MITGRIEFRDDTHGVTAWYEFGDGGKKKNPKDYVRGEIIRDGSVLSKIYGNMMGYLDFDDQRYWDVRYAQSYVPTPIPREENVLNDNEEGFKLLLQSDTTLRSDSMALIDGEVEQA